ncbi:MAG TPA: NAD(P)H-dependent oxidoreductase [Candidatus Paceibacterota bacterium]|nr:NAD(P)H-dependent oxidoreductase [Candidatus Paceibacterota bacterium]
MTILAISGSLRKDSFNSKLVRALAALAPSGMKLEIAEIGDLPLFDADQETSGYPAAAQALKDRILAADGIIIATPEYNRSMPGVLKNAIDWVSRPYGTNAFAGKPLLLSGVSSGKIGTAVAQSHLRDVFLYLEARVIGQPELYLGPAKELFDESGAIVNDKTKELLAKALSALASEVGRK